MSEDRLALEIREAFDSTYEASPGLEHRVLSGIPWETPRDRRSMPRVAGAFGAAFAALIVVALVLPIVLGRLSSLLPGAYGPDAPAYSLAAVSGGSLFVVQRQGANVLLESTDGGRTWVRRLQFAGIYTGMEMFGAGGFIWSIDMGSTSGCPQHCTFGNQALTAYRTVDAGATWAALPATSFPVIDAYFLDAADGWAVSSSPQIGPLNETLYATTDGGRTWAVVGPLPQPAPNGQIFGVGHYRVTFHRQADGGVIGWYQGATRLSSTTDGGHTWHPVTLSVPAEAAGSATNPMQPVFSGDDGLLPIGYYDPKGPDNATANRIYLYVSHDGGTTWTDPRPAPAGFAPVGDDIAVSILDSNHAWLTSQSLSGGDNVQASPAVARTADGGATWKVAQHAPRILQMAFSDARHGYALDVTGIYNTNGILRTVDGGATWQRVTVPLFPAGSSRSAG